MSFLHQSTPVPTCLSGQDAIVKLQMQSKSGKDMYHGIDKSCSIPAFILQKAALYQRTVFGVQSHVADVILRYLLQHSIRH